MTLHQLIPLNLTITSSFKHFTHGDLQVLLSFHFPFLDFMAYNFFKMLYFLLKPSQLYQQTLRRTHGQS